jgi:hypothetical protein
MRARALFAAALAALLAAGSACADAGAVKVLPRDGALALTPRRPGLMPPRPVDRGRLAQRESTPFTRVGS